MLETVNGVDEVVGVSEPCRILGHANREGKGGGRPETV